MLLKTVRCPAVRCPAVSLNPPMMRETVPKNMATSKKTRAGLRPQVTVVKKGKSTLMPKTHEDTDPELEPGEKIQAIRRKWHPESPKEDSPLKDSSRSSSFEEELLTDEALRDKAWQKVQLLDTHFDAWHCDQIAKGVTGWATRDTMICDLPEHGKMQPNHPDPVGPTLGYMGECWVFDGIWSDIYDLCRFYTLGTTGDPPEFHMPREPATCGQVRDLLKSACCIGRPYLILVHSADSVMAVSMLRELHTAMCLQCLQVDLRDKSVKLLFCPFCAYVGGGGNDLSYLNHIIIVHYNASYGCGKCLKQAFGLSSALHNHKKVYLRFITKKPAVSPDSKPSSSGGGNASHDGSTRATPKKKHSKASAADSQGSSIQPASEMMPHHSRQEASCHHKPHKDLKDSSGDKKKKKKKDASPTRKNSIHKVRKDGGCH